jgi:hypothetical protein
MNSCVDSGPLIGRPFGGSAMLINKKHVYHAVNIIASERFTAIKLFNWLLITVYLPCVGTLQRELLYSELIVELQELVDLHAEYDVLIGGDFNVDLDSHNCISVSVNEFISCNHLFRCDLINPISDRNTFMNVSNNCGSAIDYMLISNCDKAVAFNILDLDINLSDHRPIMTICKQDVSTTTEYGESESQLTADVSHFRWDHAPIELYYDLTRQQLQLVLSELISLIEHLSTMNRATAILSTDDIYRKVVDILSKSAVSVIPKHKKFLQILVVPGT